MCKSSILGPCCKNTDLNQLPIILASPGLASTLEQKSPTYCTLISLPLAADSCGSLEAASRQEQGARVGPVVETGVKGPAQALPVCG